MQSILTKKTVFLLLSVCCLFLQAPGTVLAGTGEEIIHIDFDDGELDGFTTYVNGGSCALSNEDGALAVHIDSCGSLDYANQAYWDGFALTKGCVYQYSFDIACDIERELDYRLQLNGGDYHAYVSDRISAGPEKTHVSVEWTMTEETDPAPRLVFNMGYMDSMAEDPGEHTVYIDEIRLVVLDDSRTAGEEDEKDEAVTPLFGVNQTGYRPSDPKTVFLAFGNDEMKSFYITDANDPESEPVFVGTLDKPVYDSAVDAPVQHGDFSDFTEEGRWQICVETADKEKSYVSPEFEIGPDVCRQLSGDLVRMLYLQRCGCATVSEDPVLAPFLHGECHTGEALIYGTDEMKDVSGGWHDAGDYGRYVVSGVKAAADLLFAFAQWDITDDDLGTAQSGNGVPDLLDEVRYELEWLLKMQDEKSGGVYHKVTCANFPGEVAPEEETEQLILSPISLTATGDFAALMARASLIYEPYDSGFAATALEAAKRAWDYGCGLETGDGFRNPDGISTGEYPDTSAEDEFFWAAVELYLAGVLDSSEVEKRFGDGSEDASGDHSAAYPGEPLTPGLGWQCMTTYGLFDLAADMSADSSGPSGRAAKMLVQAADALCAAARDDAFHMCLGTDYPWGSNMTVANNGMTLLMADLLKNAAADDPAGDSAESEYVRLARQQLDYLLGANANGCCFVTGEGEKAPENVHHRPSQAAGAAMPGMLVGGPDSHLEDPYAQGVLQEKAPALCYVDNAQSYSTNEVAVYWNSPLIALTCAFR